MQSWLAELFGRKGQGDLQRRGATHKRHRRHGAAAVGGLPALVATYSDLLPAQKESEASLGAAFEPLARYSTRSY